jgi:hydrogenase nickel incorporation protein HypA/HybF
MHETSMINSLLNIAQKVKTKNNLINITKITITVGEMHQIIPEVMQDSFNILKTEFTGFASSQLIINQTPVKIQCQKCQKIITLSQPDFRCPHCQSTSTQIISGKELYIETLESE